MIIQVVPANNKNSCIVLTSDDQTGNGPTDIVPTGVHFGSILTGHRHTSRIFTGCGNTGRVSILTSNGDTIK